MAFYIIDKNNDKYALLLSSSNSIDVSLISGFLKKNDIPVFYDRSVFGMSCRHGDHLLPICNIYVLKKDLDLAKSLIERPTLSIDSNGNQEYENIVDRKHKHCGIGFWVSMTLCFALAVLFLAISYYAFKASEQILGYLLIVFAIFFVLISFFCFRRTVKIEP